MVEQYLTQTQQQKQIQVLAPQLRQSLELLQVPILELRALINQEMRENPILDEEPSDANEQIEVEQGESENKEEEEEREVDFKKEYEKLAKLDDDWREYFQQTRTPSARHRAEEEQRQFFMESISTKESLHEHLLMQLAYAGLNAEDRRIGELIIGNINDDGFFISTIEDISKDTSCPVEGIEKILRVIQGFDPVGIGARNVGECLLLQLRALNMEDSLAATIVRDYLPLLGAKKYKEIEKKLNISMGKLLEATETINKLDPKPGSRFTVESTTYVHPEMIISRRNGTYTISMNNDHLPHLRISKHYRRLMENPSTTKEVKRYIREKIRSGAFLIKSIHQRQQTLERIMKAIIKVQKDFLEHGVLHLKPLTMAEVASTLDIHETTVSRAIANKFVETPRGVLELKYFFSHGFEKDDGQKISNKTIQEMMQNIIGEENPCNPISDQMILEKLQQQGIHIARRTITKYREDLNILPCHMRKAL